MNGPPLEVAVALVNNTFDIVRPLERLFKFESGVMGGVPVGFETKSVTKNSMVEVYVEYSRLLIVRLESLYTNSWGKAAVEVIADNGSGMIFIE